MSMGKFLFAAICNSNKANINFRGSGVLFGKAHLHVADRCPTYIYPILFHMLNPVFCDAYWDNILAIRLVIISFAYNSLLRCLIISGSSHIHFIFPPFCYLI